MDEAYVVTTDVDGNNLCVACNISEGLSYAIEKGWTPGCVASKFNSDDKSTWYSPEELVDKFNGGWADYY
jgi:hypothetical protein